MKIFRQHHFLLKNFSLFYISQYETFVKWSITYKIKMCNNKWLLCTNFVVDTVQILLLFFNSPHLLLTLFSSTCFCVPLQFSLNWCQFLAAYSTLLSPSLFLGDLVFISMKTVSIYSHLWPALRQTHTVEMERWRVDEIISGFSTTEFKKQGHWFIKFFSF